MATEAMFKRIIKYCLNHFSLFEALAKMINCCKEPETFDFLGFTHYCSKTGNGKNFKMKRKTSQKKFNATYKNTIF